MPGSLNETLDERLDETLDETHNERLHLSWASLYERATGLQAKLRAQDTTFVTQNVRAIWEEVVSATSSIGDNDDDDDDEAAQLTNPIHTCNPTPNPSPNSDSNPNSNPDPNLHPYPPYSLP